MGKTITLLMVILSISVSAQNTITWTIGMNIAANSFGNLHPRITTDANGNPLVIWGRMSDESVFISRWTGTAFTMPVKINPMGMTVATASWMGPDIAAKGDTVYVVMKRTPEALDTNHIYMVHSFDGGMTFSTPARVDFIADSISRFPTVTTDNTGNPIVGFMKFNSGFLDARWSVTGSTDFGNTFSDDVKASGWSGTGAVVCDCCPGAIVNSGNTVAMLYRDNFSNIRDMWAGISTDNGNSFTQGMPVDQGNWMIMSCPSSGPDGVIIGDTLYTTYMSGAGGNSLVYLSKSGLSGITGSTGTALTGMFGGLSLQNYPRIAHAGNALAIVWKQNVNGADQLAMRFTNNFAVGFPTAYDTVDMNDISNADVALTDGNIFVVWEDDNSGTVKYRSGTFTPVNTSVNEIKENLFSVYPNPASFAITVQSGVGLQNAELKIMTLLGETQIQKTISPNTKIHVDVSELPVGIYIIQIKSSNKLFTQKLIKN